MKFLEKPDLQGEMEKGPPSQMSFGAGSKALMKPSKPFIIFGARDFQRISTQSFPTSNRGSQTTFVSNELSTHDVEISGTTMLPQAIFDSSSGSVSMRAQLSISSMLRGCIIRQGSSLDTTHFTTLYSMRMPKGPPKGMSSMSGAGSSTGSFFGDTTLGRFIKASFSVETMLKKIKALMDKTFDLYEKHYLKS